MRRMLASKLRNICSRWNAVGGIGIMLFFVSCVALIVSWLVSLIAQSPGLALSPWILLGGVFLFIAGFVLKVVLDFVVPKLEGDGGA